MEYIINVCALIVLLVYFLAVIIVYFVKGNVNITTTFLVSTIVSFFLFVFDKIKSIERFTFIFFILSIFFFVVLMLQVNHNKKRRYKDMK